MNTLTTTTVRTIMADENLLNYSTIDLLDIAGQYAEAAGLTGETADDFVVEVAQQARMFRGALLFGKQALECPLDPPHAQHNCGGPHWPR